MTDTLQHHGVKGQKWGIRRYQNKDGSLTALGRKREEKDKLKSANKELKALRAENAKLKKQTSANSRRISELSDDELRQKINRLNMEKQYNDIYNQLHPNKPSTGKAFVKKILGEAIVPAAVNVGKSALEKSLKKAFGLEDKPDPNKQLELASKKLEYASKQLDYESKKIDLHNKKNPKNDDLADEVKRLENEFKRDELKYKISKLGKDDTSVADIVKTLNKMSKEEKDAIKDAAQVQENINKLKKSN